ncbi:MAG: membrane protein insertion efficiency factor YidD [Methylophilaceae bacterium]
MLKLFIKGYQRLVSPFIGQHCRYYPTCSQYALESINKHGPFKGGYFAIRRILRCHPWHDGGYDPIP